MGKCRGRYGVGWAQALITAVSMVSIDLAYLKASVNMYTSGINTAINKNMSTTLTIRKIPAAFTYALMLACVLVVVMPLADHDIALSAGYGALLGLIVYGVYNGTNMATIPKWGYHMAIQDTLWGCTVMSISSVIAASTECV